jgi:hypothetical protein
MTIISKSGIVFLAGAVLVAFSSQALAQYNQQDKRPKVGNAPILPMTDFSTKVNLPQLPEYAGQAKFRTGFKHDSLNGPNYVQEYFCKESPKEVAEWYRAAFRNYQWNITSDENNTLMAKAKDGSTCQIIANPNYDKNGQTALMISYHEYHSPPPSKGGAAATQNTEQ